MQFSQALGGQHSPQCCSGPFPVPHGATSQQVTALHHCHRAAAATGAQPWLILNLSRTWGKALEKLKASGTSGLANASLLPEVTTVGGSTALSQE